MKRAQISVELFFAMLLFTVFFLWMMNYSGVLSANLGQLSEQAQAKSVASSIAYLASTSCSRQVSASFLLPCASYSGQLRGLLVSASTATVNVSFAGGGPWDSAIAACPVVASISSACQGTFGDWVCLTPSNNLVSITKGHC